MCIVIREESLGIEDRAAFRALFYVRFMRHSACNVIAPDVKVNVVDAVAMVCPLAEVRMERSFGRPR